MRIFYCIFLKDDQLHGLTRGADDDIVQCHPAWPGDGIENRFGHIIGGKRPPSDRFDALFAMNHIFKKWSVDHARMDYGDSDLGLHFQPKGLRKLIHSGLAGAVDPPPG